jgi:hypothetical protein
MNILDKIKNAFAGTSAEYQEFENVISKTREALVLEKSHFYEAKVSALPVYKEEIALWPDRKKMDFIIHCTEKFITFSKSNNSWSQDRPDVQRHYIRSAYITQLLKTKIFLEDAPFKYLYSIFETFRSSGNAGFYTLPVAPLISLVERQSKEQPLSASMLSTLQQIKADLLKIKESYFEKNKLKLTEKIDGILHHALGNAEEVKPRQFLGEDAFSEYANQKIGQLPDSEKVFWYRLITHAQKASGGKPTKKYLEEARKIIAELGAEKFKPVVNDWFVFLSHHKEVAVTQNHTYGGRTTSYVVLTFLTSVNIEAIKGFIWMCAEVNDPAILRNLAALSDRCYRKMPGVGPVAAAVSNACFFALAQSKSMEGIGQLSRLRLRIKQNTAQNLIEKYLNEAAAAQGVSLHEIEDLAVDDFGLTDGKRTDLFDDYKAEIVITAVGKSELNWYKPDGAPQKSVPAFVKEKYADKLKELKDIQKQIDLTTTSQRDRIDRMLRADRKWSLENFESLYLYHGLMGFLTKKIIWNFNDGRQTSAAILIDGKWTANDGRTIEPAPGSTVSLWHPATETVAEIKKWRDFLIAHKIQQPLKQAFREVYLLTEAEVNTRSYSNRMAAHVLKQHQFNMLAKMRGWKYALMGCYDDGRYNEAAELKLPEYGLRAEYWINELNADGAYNDTGIWNYITTDQIRFVNAETNAQVDLVHIPAIPFSEVLRDVDLFVGVASVGNDPTWQDSGGVPAYRDYWTTYSFGDLSEVAKNRREILTNLVPRLKIGKVAEVRDKFLVVKGKLRTYKIHIGSTNILMEPNDQYLCIVPDRSQKNFTENVFLPFEGDTGLSIILSKAFLLADDDQITDRTITSQINRK